MVLIIWNSLWCPSLPDSSNCPVSDRIREIHFLDVRCFCMAEAAATLFKNSRKFPRDDCQPLSWMSTKTELQQWRQSHLTCLNFKYKTVNDEYVSLFEKCKDIQKIENIYYKANFLLIQGDIKSNHDKQSVMLFNISVFIVKTKIWKENV